VGEEEPLKEVGVSGTVPLSSKRVGEEEPVKEVGVSGTVPRGHGSLSRDFRHKKRKKERHHASTMCNNATMHTHLIIKCVQTAPGGFIRNENATIFLTSTFNLPLLLIKGGVSLINFAKFDDV